MTAKERFLVAVENLRRLTKDDAYCDRMLREQEEWEARLAKEMSDIGLRRALTRAATSTRVSIIGKMGFGGRIRRSEVVEGLTMILRRQSSL